MAEDKVEVKFKSDALKKILKNFKHPGYVRVGILQSSGKIARSDQDNKSDEKPKGKKKTGLLSVLQKFFSSVGTIDNASLGAVHEFGSKKRNIPPRSFLRMPLEDDFDAELEKSAADKDFCELMVKDPNAFLNRLGQKALKVVQNAFNNGGSSQTKWTALKPKYAKTKNVNMILVETSQLRDSVSYEVVGGN